MFWLRLLAVQLVDWLGLNTAQANTDATLCPVHQRPYEVLQHLPTELVAQVAKFYAPYNELLFRLLRDRGLEALADRLSRQWSDPVEQWLTNNGNSIKVPLEALLAPELIVAPQHQQHLSKSRIYKQGMMSQTAQFGPTAAAVRSSTPPLKMQLESHQQLLVECSGMKAAAVANVQLYRPGQMLVNCRQSSAEGSSGAPPLLEDDAFSLPPFGEAPAIGGFAREIINALMGSKSAYIGQPLSLIGPQVQGTAGGPQGSISPGGVTSQPYWISASLPQDQQDTDHSKIPAQQQQRLQTVGALTSEHQAWPSKSAGKDKVMPANHEEQKPEFLTPHQPLNISTGKPLLLGQADPENYSAATSGGKAFQQESLANNVLASEESEGAAAGPPGTVGTLHSAPGADMMIQTPTGIIGAADTAVAQLASDVHIKQH
jgi:hypothetical protein